MWGTNDTRAKNESKKTIWDSTAVAQVKVDGVLDWVEVRRNSIWVEHVVFTFEITGKGS